MEVLTTFIRDHSHEQWPLPGPDGAVPDRSARPDVQAALTVIGRRDAERDIRPIDLGRAILTRARLNANLSGADTYGFLHALHYLRARARAHLNANLARADLSGADLSGATLLFVDLSGAYLAHTNLSGADLSGADLTFADLSAADLSGAYLFAADLTHAYLFGADLTGARLFGANLADATLIGVDLSSAVLVDSRADLPGSRAYLPDEYRAYTNFSGARLADVRWPEDTPVPEGWERDASSGRLARAVDRRSESTGAN